jgi:hypothetical protein
MIDDNNNPIEGGIPNVDLSKTKVSKDTTDKTANSSTQKFGRTSSALFGYGFHSFYEDEETNDDEKELLDETDKIINDLLTKIKGDGDVLPKTVIQIPSFKDIESQSLKKAIIELLKLFVNITDENSKVAVINELMQKLKADTFSKQNKAGLLNNLKSKDVVSLDESIIKEIELK